MSAFEDFLLLTGRDVPLGGPRGMTVRRALPARETSLIGAWCFADHFGPDDVSATGGMQVARHPHTGLATVSWLFDGAITHLDSIGSHVLVSPGDVDLMVAGSGITHSEFSTRDTTILHGVQLWYALPDRTRFREQEFALHTPAEQAAGPAAIRVGMGTVRATTADGAVLTDTSPVVTDTDLVMAQLDLRAGHTLRIDLEAGFEYAVLVDRGAAELEAARAPVAGTPAAGTPAPGTSAMEAPETGTRPAPRARAARSDLAVLPDGTTELHLTAEPGEDLRVMLLGGEPLGEDILMWWNFIGRSHEEIVAFRARYQAEIGVELPLAEAPISPVARDRGGLAAEDEQFGPFPRRTPDALPAPRLPNGRLRSRGRTSHHSEARATS